MFWQAHIQGSIKSGEKSKSRVRAAKVIVRENDKRERVPRKEAGLYHLALELGGGWKGGCH